MKKGTLQVGLALVLMIGGIVLGFYVGLKVCFVGGIIQIINGIKCDPISAVNIAWGVGKLFVASFAGVLSGIVPFFVGQYLID